jgi:hypothetical protein
MAVKSALILLGLALTASAGELGTVPAWSGTRLAAGSSRPLTLQDPTAGITSVFRARLFID